jgi:hypothetical protein
MADSVMVNFAVLYWSVFAMYYFASDFSWRILMTITMNRTIIVWLVVLILTTGAAQADELYDELVICRGLPSAEARVLCYDSAVDRSRQKGGPRPATTAAPPPVSPAESAVATSPAAVEPAAAAATGASAANISQEELFGQDSDEVQRTVEEATGDERIDTLSAQITKLQQSGYDKVAITLDNGQVWQQIETSKLRLRVGDNIEIERAALGSFQLRKEGSKRMMRVSRKD